MLVLLTKFDTVGRIIKTITILDMIIHCLGPICGIKTITCP